MNPHVCWLDGRVGRSIGALIIIPSCIMGILCTGLATPSSPVHTKQGLNFDLPNQVPTATDTIKKPAAGQSAAEAVKKTAVQSVAEITAKKTAIQTNNPIGYNKPLLLLLFLVCFMNSIVLR